MRGGNCKRRVLTKPQLWCKWTTPKIGMHFGLDGGGAQCAPGMGAAYKGKFFWSFWLPIFFWSLVDIAPISITRLVHILGGHNSSMHNWVSDDMALVASRGRKDLRIVFVGQLVSWSAIKCMCSSQMIGHCSSYGRGSLLAVYHTNDWISSIYFNCR